MDSPGKQFGTQNLLRKLPFFFLFFFFFSFFVKLMVKSSTACRQTIVIIDWCCMCRDWGDNKSSFLVLCYGVFALTRAVKVSACWSDGTMKHQSSDLWHTIPLYLTWCIWKEHNARTFDVVEDSFVLYETFILKIFVSMVNGHWGFSLLFKKILGLSL